MSCENIEEYYKCLERTGNYQNIISQQTVGPFGGKRMSYTIPTDTGPVKVRCNNGVDTFFKVFSPLEVMFVGSVQGSIGANTGNISSEGSNFLATQISKVDEYGHCKVSTLFTTADITLPVPQIKQRSMVSNKNFLIEDVSNGDTSQY
jgi:hypothetical protein